MDHSKRKVKSVFPVLGYELVLKIIISLKSCMYKEFAVKDDSSGSLINVRVVFLMVNLFTVFFKNPCILIPFIYISFKISKLVVSCNQDCFHCFLLAEPEKTRLFFLKHYVPVSWTSALIEGNK